MKHNWSFSGYSHNYLTTASRSYSQPTELRKLSAVLFNPHMVQLSPRSTKYLAIWGRCFPGALNLSNGRTNVYQPLCCSCSVLLFGGKVQERVRALKHFWETKAVDSSVCLSEIDCYWPFGLAWIACWCKEWIGIYDRECVHGDLHMIIWFPLLFGLLISTFSIPSSQSQFNNRGNILRKEQNSKTIKTDMLFGRSIYSMLPTLELPSSNGT